MAAVVVVIVVVVIVVVIVLFVVGIKSLYISRMRINFNGPCNGY